LNLIVYSSFVKLGFFASDGLKANIIANKVYPMITGPQMSVSSKISSRRSFVFCMLTNHKL